MLESVVELLACPHCGGGLVAVDRSLRCPTGHVFDIAKQGYVSLLAGGGTGMVGDDAAMVAARHDVLEAGHFRLIGDQVAGDVAAVSPASGAVLDVGAGTGYYLRTTLDHRPDLTGVALDLSKFAGRKAAKAHPRAGAVVADAWRSLPLRDDSVSTVLNVFAPRNAVEMARVLRPGGHLVVVTPNAGHLGALVDSLGLINVDERKSERLDEQLRELFVPVARTDVTFGLSLRPEDVEAVVAMGPSARHVSADALRARIRDLADPVTVTASVTSAVYRLRRE